MDDHSTRDDDSQLPPAGPDTIQRFNGLRLLVASVVAILLSGVYLAAHIRTGTGVVLPMLALVGSVILLVVSILFSRRFWARPNGVTIDEADPRRTPDQQRRRDDRVRKNNAQMTPREEVIVGVILLPVGLAWPIALSLSGSATGGDLLFGLGLAALGVYLLINAAVVRFRGRR